MSTEPVQALTHSVDAWCDYRAKHPATPISLRLAILQDVDLRQRDLSYCDLSGANLSGSNLDSCRFHKTVMNDCVFVDTSLVSTTFSNLEILRGQYRDCNFRDCVIELVDWRSSDLTGSTFGGATLKHVLFENTLLDKIHYSRVRLHDAEFVNCTADTILFDTVEARRLMVNRCRWNGFELINSTLTSSWLTQSEFSRSKWTDSDFGGSELTQVLAESVSVGDCDFSRARLCKVDLSKLRVDESVLFDTSFSECIWPEQEGRVKLSGRYEASPHLLSHPVQDVRGVSPILRRSIADAQYLRELTTKDTSWFMRVAIRLWGVTSGYGQSLLRLTAASGIVLLFCLVIVLGLRGQLVGDRFVPVYFLDAARMTLLAFLGLDVGDQPIPVRRVLIVCRVAGFFALGVWIGIAANKLGKLSSE